VETLRLQTTGLDRSSAGVRPVTRKGLVGAQKIEMSHLVGNLCCCWARGSFTSKRRG
jgi:hypothetical protein